MSEMPSWRVLRDWFTFRPWQRHGLVLSVGGLVYIFLGVSFFNVGDLDQRREQALVIALRMAPIKLWAVCFILAGILALASSRWPTFSDSWGYAVLTGLSSAWAAIYLLGYLIGGAAFINITYSLVWFLVAFHWWAISGLVNPERRKAVRHGPD